MIYLDDLLAATAGTLATDARATVFAGFAFDSRLVQPGELFVAVKTERGDGHDWIREACQKGATGVLAQQPVEAEGGAVTTILVDDTRLALQQWGRHILRRYGTEVIGVTGSTGKTSSKEAIAHVLAGHRRVFRNPGNWNGRYGLPLALGQLSAEHELAVLEMASDSLGEIADLAALAPPCLAVVTTVQPAHLDTFGDLETIAQEKSALVRALPDDGIAFLNADDPHVRAMAEQTRARVIGFGFGKDALLRASDWKIDLDGTHFTLQVRPPLGRASRRLSVPLLGQHLLYPVLAAVGVGLHYGMALDQIIERLASLPRVAGRLNLLPGLGGSWLLDDSYNASPAAMLAALEVLAALPARRRVAVLGDMAELGAQAETAHERVGERAAGVVDRLVVKGEQARTIGRAAARAGLDDDRIAITYTPEDAARAAQSDLGAGDVLLIKGGMVARMERVAARLLADPARDAARLVRQNAAWQQLPPRPHARPTWLEVDLDAIAANARRLKALVGPQVEVMAIMKADAYGHGALKSAQTALHNGASWLGVATLTEAEALRQAGMGAPILVLGYTPAWQARAALREEVRVTVFSEEVARALSDAAAALGREARVHVKVDTGMHRLGLFPAEVLPFVRLLHELPGIQVEGIFTHFSVADTLDPWHLTYTEQQLASFQEVLSALDAAGLRPPLAHAANSAATLAWPQAHFNMVRPGIALFGLAPSAEVPLPDGFRPALSWKTQVAQVKTLPPHSYVSYGATYRTEEAQRIAVIPVGYADGFRRAPATWGEVLVRGQRAPVVGRVCMDQAMLDVSAIPDVRQGDEVVLIGQQGEASLTVEEVAARLGTIPYEVVSAILARVPRMG